MSSKTEPKFTEEAQRAENALWQLKNAIKASSSAFSPEIVKIDEFRKWLEDTYGTK